MYMLQCYLFRFPKVSRISTPCSIFFQPLPLIVVVDGIFEHFITLLRFPFFHVVVVVFFSFVFFPFHLNYNGRGYITKLFISLSNRGHLSKPGVLILNSILECMNITGVVEFIK